MYRLNLFGNKCFERGKIRLIILGYVKKHFFILEPYKVGSKDIVERLKKHKRKLHT